MSVYGIMMRIMKRQDKEIVGYRFLISAGFSDLLLLANYGIWPGLTILLKSEIIPENWRTWQQLYLDWAWFAMVSHYSVVSWSRWMAIRKPLDFRNQARNTSYSLCALCYVVALVLVLSTHFQPWYVTFYYEPSSYGMLAEDFALYLSGGQSALFLAFHIAAIVPPIVFYGWSIILLYHRRTSMLLVNHQSVQNSIETRLLMPCLINVVTFIIGQVLITVGTGECKWAGYTVMILFAA
uniref:7TM_GPCR_Srx domain-containing protein n=1 Tax=Caenorhabditis japonica TaxID=281687 RepID=A0A8R1IT93_CAEJA